MLHSGLVSITFRALSVQEIVDLARTAGVEGIEARYGDDPYQGLLVSRESSGAAMSMCCRAICSGRARSST